MIFENMDRIIFAGDSVTDAESGHPVGEGLFNGSGKGYVMVIENLLNTWYPELFLRITNSGISGHTSKDLLNRFQRDVVDLKPNWVSICIGINDVWRQFDCPAMTDVQVPTDEYEMNVEKMILSVKDKIKGIFILTPYYMEPNKTDKMRSRMDEYGDICKKLAEKYGCVLVDLQDMFDRYFQYRHSSYIAWDRIHPNSVGVTLIAREFLKYCEFDYDHASVSK